MREIQKSETRNPNEARSPKSEIGHWSFGHSDLIRHSGFCIRILLAEEAVS